MTFSSRDLRYIWAIILATVSERFNIIWYGTVVALDADGKGVGSVWVGWWIFTLNLLSSIVCVYLTTNYTQFLPEETAAFWLLNSSAILLAFISCALGCIGYLPNLLYNMGNFLSAILRGTLSAVVTVSVNTIIIMEFKNNVETLKMFNGLSYTVACIFSILIGYGVYQLQTSLFISALVTSIISLITIMPVFFTMPRKSTIENDEKFSAQGVSQESYPHTKLSPSCDQIEAKCTLENIRKRVVVWRLLIVPEVCLALVSQVWVFSGLGAHAPIHAPFLKETFGLEPIHIGIVSCSPFLAMALGSFFFGFIGRTVAARKVSLIGCLFLQGTSMIFEGPDPSICSIPVSIYLHVLSLFVSAFAFSSHLVLTAEEMRHAAEVHGFKNNLDVSCAIGSLLTASEYASGLVGPLLGGYIGDNLGFGRTLGILGFLCYVLGGIRLAFLIRQDKFYVKR